MEVFKLIYLNYFYIGVKSWWQAKVKDPVESCTEKQYNIGLQQSSSQQKGWKRP